MQKQDKEFLFARWLDDELSPEEQTEFEHLCRDDKEFSDRVATMAKFESMSQQFDALDVPEWHRESTLVPQVGAPQIGSEAPKARSWWQWSGLPMVSLATSMAAILMVTLNVQVNVSDQGVLIGFANSYSEQQIQDLMDQRLQDYQQTSNQQLAMYSQQLQDQQKQFSTQLADYVLTANRSERKEDFAELIKFVNQQRSDDQLYYASQLNRLEQDIAYSTPSQQRMGGSNINPITIDD